MPRQIAEIPQKPEREPKAQYGSYIPLRTILKARACAHACRLSQARLFEAALEAEVERTLRGASPEERRAYEERLAEETNSAA